MELKTILTCPLGHKCEEARDNAIHRCAWFVHLRGRNSNTGEEQDEKGCAMHWMPVLLIETAGAARGTSAAVESFRNEMVMSNQQAASLMLAQQQRRAETCAIAST